MTEGAQQKLVFGRDRDPMVVEELTAKGGPKSKSGTLLTNPMLPVYGPGPRDAQCRGCVHLLRYQQSSSWFKCERRRNTSGAATDHRATWPACGLFEAQS